MNNGSPVMRPVLSLVSHIRRLEVRFCTSKRPGFPGKGSLTLTGQIGQVMKESAQGALSLVRSRGESIGVKSEEFRDYDIHVHVPAGAVPKDGPSAGVAMFT